MKKNLLKLIEELKILQNQDKIISANRLINKFVIDNKDKLSGLEIDLLLSIGEALWLGNNYRVNNLYEALI